MDWNARIQDVQKHLIKEKIDGWLLYDFSGLNSLARDFLKIDPELLITRRFFYWIPQKGEPVKIVHAIESHALDGWPGQKRTFLSWQSLEKEVKSVLQGAARVAMEYSPKNAIPYVSRVDAGTVDLVRSFGVEVVSSGPFLAFFTAVLNPEQMASHLRAAKELDRIANETWRWIAAHLKQGIDEFAVQQKIASEIAKAGLISESLPIAAVNAHSADPHYVPQHKGSSPIREGDWILIDLWAKEKQEGAVYGDITRVAVAAKKPAKRQEEIFRIVRNAQKNAVGLIKKRFKEKKPVAGWEVDDAAREGVKKAGYGDFFIHRTGHSIEVNLHGSGAHMDNLEMHDERPLLPSTCFSIEPGIYLPGEFGVRLEHDVCIHPDGRVEVTGGEQDQIVCLFE